MADFEHVFLSLWWDSAKLHLCGLHKEADNMKEAMWLLKSQHAEINDLKARLAERDCKVPLSLDGEGER